MLSIYLFLFSDEFKNNSLNYKGLCDPYILLLYTVMDQYVVNRKSNYNYNGNYILLCKENIKNEWIKIKKFDIIK